MEDMRGQGDMVLSVGWMPRSVLLHTRFAVLRPQQLKQLNAHAIGVVLSLLLHDQYTTLRD